MCSTWHVTAELLWGQQDGNHSQELALRCSTGLHTVRSRYNSWQSGCTLLYHTKPSPRRSGLSNLTNVPATESPFRNFLDLCFTLRYADLQFLAIFAHLSWPILPISCFHLFLLLVISSSAVYYLSGHRYRTNTQNLACFKHCVLLSMKDIVILQDLAI